MTQEEWIVIGQFGTQEQIDQEVSRISEVALDVGLNPEMVIGTQKVEQGFELIIHPEFFNYFQRT
ncbi:hypothetical protein [Desulfonauticus submarinus]|uniref:Uncharacterized protein n=1 Tax=Desulfonauticus submarinus TaxID=206665 RepID=A0A1H0G2E7_9BACT|nr:hypothetical protein [Desulfonauticus submarinus]SDO01065.1 hypothetical protein SAMN04488516_11617 [Desulfonauticus submarinus]